MTITLQPVNFAWPNSQSNEAQQIGWDDYKISDIVNYLQETFGLQNISVYADQNQQNRLDESMTILQQGLNQNCTLYLFQEENQDNGDIMVKLYLDGQDMNEACQISINNTCQEIIEQIFEGTQIVRMELKNSKFQLLASEPYRQIKNIPNYDKNLHFFAYTIKQNITSISTELQVKTLELDQGSTIKLKHMILMVDKKGKSVMFEFLCHHFKGILTEENGLFQDYSNQELVFKKKNGLEYAVKDDLGLVIKWPNDFYSQIDLNEVKQASSLEEIKMQIHSIEFLNQLLILENLTLFIDPNGEYISFKYKQEKHKLEGYLLEANGKELDIDENKYKFFEHSSLQIAYNDENGFGILVKWRNSTYSSVKVC